MNIVLRDYPTGVETLEALAKGEVDIAEAAEFPFVAALFRNRDLRIIACNDQFENDYLLAHGDRGIARFSDLKGKRIGLAPGSITEYFLGRSLASNGMKPRDVILVDMAPSRFVRAFAEGSVHAVVAWQPYVYRMLSQVRDAMVWKVQGGQPVFGVLIAKEQWLSRRGEAVRRFLASLREAEDFLVRRPGKAREILRERLGYEDAYIASIWPRHKFALSLDQTLIIAMRDEAHWLAEKSSARRKSLPDFTHYIYTDGLRSVKPHAVNIIR